MPAASGALPHLLFLTGKLAEKNLARVLAEMAPRPFTYEVRALGITVAALITVEFIQRRLKDLTGFDRVILPGRCRGDLHALEAHFGLPFERGPEELKDLPAHFGTRAKARSLDAHDILIFGEIVDAPHVSVDAVLARAARYRADGADVIDVGCLPDVPFPALAAMVRALKDAGYRVSVDSLREEDLVEGAKAGADYLFSLTEDTLWIAEEYPVTPILIGREAASGDPLALDLLMETARWLGIGIVTLMHTIDPEAVILGGAMLFGGEEAPVGRAFIERVRAEVKRRTFPLLAAKTLIRFASLAGDAGSIGAAGLARLEHRRGRP